MLSCAAAGGGVNFGMCDPRGACSHDFSSGVEASAARYEDACDPMRLCSGVTCDGVSRLPYEVPCGCAGDRRVEHSIGGAVEEKVDLRAQDLSGILYRCAVEV